MRHLALKFVSRPPEDKPQFIPILLRFREVYSLMAGEAKMDFGIIDLPLLVSNHLIQQPEFKNLQPSVNWFGEQLKQGRCLVMLDGLDEVPKAQRQAVRQWVDQQMKTYDKTQFILTSRPHGFELQADEPSYPIQVDLKLRVLDFNPDQKQDFVEKWYRTVYWRIKWEPLLSRSQQSADGAVLDEEQARLRSEQEADEAAKDLVRQIVNSPALNDLARNPLLVTMIASTHRAQTVLPKRRVELYDKIFDLLLGTRPYVKKTALTLTATENKAILQVLAWQLVNAEITQFSPKQGGEWIAAGFQRCVKNREFSPEQFWDEMTDVAGLLVEKELGYLEFAHQTFQEYLAAKHLREMIEGEELLKSQLTNDRWQEVTRFYAALGDATAIIDALLEDPNEYTLPLARRCMEEGRGVEPGTLESLQAALQELLKVSQMSSPSPVPRTVAVGVTETLTISDRLSEELAEVQLVQRFQNLLTLSETTKITRDFITHGEYEMLLTARLLEQFHATAQKGPGGPPDSPVFGITWKDARWFCAWLSTQSNIQESGKVFEYRLPTLEEIEQASELDLQGKQPWTQDSEIAGDVLLVVREELPERYGQLVNYLANGRWKEADQETYEVMKQVAGGAFTSQRLKEFPCEDLRIIDRLWVKFSGGKFGFSVQKQLYV
ncbi:signal transduction protein, partial [filamentous cyanobacterium CCP5]